VGARPTADACRGPGADVLRVVAGHGADTVARWRGQSLPPRRLLARSSSPTRWEFASAGQVNRDCCRLGGFRPDDRMLDIGSGLGRVAITPRFPTFTFGHLDLHHHDQNPGGEIPITKAQLPFADGVFDLAMLVAMNHLSDPEHRTLVGEAGRVLRRGGTYVGTWFVVDETTRGRFPSQYAGIACDETSLRDTLTDGSLTPRARYPGSWRGDGAAVSLQDVVVVTGVGR
jgi:SAM-dependent methyltransferase